MRDPIILSVKRLFSAGVCLTLAVLLSGCVTFQKIDFRYTPSAYPGAVGSPHIIAVQVEERRPFVLSGNKKPFYIGHFRGGYGNMWDASTEGKVPLAEQIRDDLTRELKTLGFETGASGADRGLRVRIIDYNFDALISGKFWYEMEVAVLDGENKVLAKDTVKGAHIIRGSVMFGPVGAFKKELPVIYHVMIEKIVRNNPAVLEALK